jgi:hypothetical protein
VVILRRRVVAVLACVVVAAATLVIWRLTNRGPAFYAATVTIDTTAKVSGDLSASYVGLSIESAALDTGTIGTSGSLVPLLRNLGSSVLRFGGNSADTSFTGISPSALHNLTALADASGWSVLYTEDEGGYHPARVAADAGAVSAALGVKLFAFACGNEPDAYSHNGLRPRGYSVSNYLRQATACLKSVRAAAPQAPLEGPDTAGSRRWFSDYARQDAGVVSWLGQHYYPMGCASPSDRPAALVTTMLSPGLAASEAKALAWYVETAKGAGEPLLITETNSACGGGIRGLSDAYASALWAIDYALTGAELGVAGMYFHTGSLDSYCIGYAVLCPVGSDRYRPQPIYYGLLFAHLLGTGRFLPVKVSMPAKSGGNVAAFALKAPGGGLRLMLENLSKKQADTTLRVGRYSGSAAVLTLTGPDPLATSGVQIQGASVAADDSFRPGSPDTVRCTSAGCPVTLPPYSAALVTLS